MYNIKKHPSPRPGKGRVKKIKSYQHPLCKEVIVHTVLTEEALIASLTKGALKIISWRYMNMFSYIKH